MRLTPVQLMRVAPIAPLDINPFITFFASCTLHFIEYSAILNYSSISYPLTLSVVNGSVNQPFPRPKSPNKLLHTNCASTFVILPGKGSPVNFATIRNHRDWLLSAIDSIHPATAFSPQRGRHYSIQHLVFFLQRDLYKNWYWTRRSATSLSQSLYSYIAGTVPLLFLYYVETLENVPGTRSQFLVLKRDVVKAFPYCYHCELTYEHYMTCKAPLYECAARVSNAFIAIVKGGKGVKWYYNVTVGLNRGNIKEH